jgi:hypothetical protein
MPTFIEFTPINTTPANEASTVTINTALIAFLKRETVRKGMLPKTGTIVTEGHGKYDVTIEELERVNALLIGKAAKKPSTKKTAKPKED